jgi:hypothetical protein
LPSSGEQRALREKKIEMSEVLFSIARVIEVSLESSFQPTIQVLVFFDDDEFFYIDFLQMPKQDYRFLRVYLHIYCLLGAEMPSIGTRL